MMKVTVGTDPHLDAPTRLPRHVRRHYADGRTAYITVSRKQILRQGLITFNDRAIYCAVHDLSATGAKLQVYAELPGSFEFSLLGHRLRVTAEVKWSQSGYIGVAFTNPLD